MRGAAPVTENTQGKALDSRRLPFLFLMDLESIFRSKYLGRCVGSNVDTLLDSSTQSSSKAVAKDGKGKTHGPEIVGKNTELDRDVADLLGRAERGDNDITGLARQEIENVRTVMIESVEKVLERGERINLLVSKTDRMNNHAVEFRKRTTNVKRSMWWANIKFKALLGLGAIVIIYLSMGFLCGLPVFDRCFS